MKRASYREGVEWIALNDSAGEDAYNEEAIAGFISTCLLADLFGVEREKVATDIVKFRKKNADRYDFDDPQTVQIDESSALVAGKIWYTQHQTHVDRIIVGEKHVVKPSGFDLVRPELWKPCHWRWFFEATLSEATK